MKQAVAFVDGEALSAAPKLQTPVLRVCGLTLAYHTGAGGVNEAVRDVDLTVNRGEILGLVGESGCGKSTTALAALGYRSRSTSVLAGAAWFDGGDLMALPASALRKIWGRRIAFVSQQASLALNPSLKIGRQLADPIVRHLGLTAAALRQRQVELLRIVEIPDPERALDRYPFQFSGGQQQRIAIAIAICCNPQLLVLDEPTTGLDATTQARISELLVKLARVHGMGMIYVSHDLGLLHAIADRIAVMYAGQIVEMGTAGDIVASPRHPYTRGLVQAAPSLTRPHMVSGIPGLPPASTVRGACAFAPRCHLVQDGCLAQDVALVQSDAHLVRCCRTNEVAADRPAPRPLLRSSTSEVILAVRDLVCAHNKTSAPAVSGVGFEVRRGETLGIMGESGSGKSTLLRAVAGLLAPVSGTIAFRGLTLAPTASGRPRSMRGDMQLIFQNPDSSLNPRQTIRAILTRPIRLFRDRLTRSEETTELERLLDSVQLQCAVLDRFPSELSGGQKQRIAIARAFAGRPAVLLCDEITSALDVSVQASILELLANLSMRHRVATIFVSHDLAVIRMLADHTMVMRNGIVVEAGPTADVFSAPRNDYTRTLLAAVHDLPNQEMPAS